MFENDTNAELLMYTAPLPLYGIPCDNVVTGVEGDNTRR